VPSVDQNKSLPSEPAHPICPTCNVAMWMTRVDHFGSADKPNDHRIYECQILREQIYHATAARYLRLAWHAPYTGGSATELSVTDACAIARVSDGCTWGFQPTSPV
jgi:hypothetical protein